MSYKCLQFFFFLHKNKAAAEMYTRDCFAVCQVLDIRKKKWASKNIKKNEMRRDPRKRRGGESWAEIYDV